MASSGSSPESHRPHRRRDPGRSSRSRDDRHRTHIEEVDYSDDDNTALPSINPPPGTEIARGPPVPDPPPPSDTVTGDTPHQATTSHRTVSGPPLTPRPPRSQFPSLSCPVPLPRPHVMHHNPPTVSTLSANTPYQSTFSTTSGTSPSTQASTFTLAPLVHHPPTRTHHAPAPGNRLLPGTIAPLGRHAPPSHGSLIGDAPIPGAALPILVDRVQLDAVHQ